MATTAARLKAKPDNYAFKEGEIMGALCRTDPRHVQLDVWRCVIKDGEEQSYIKRERMRTLREVYLDLRRRIDLVCCEKCSWHRKRKSWDDFDAKCLKCGADCYWFIDEYFSGPDTLDKFNDAPVPHDFRSIACYPVTGGSEGHYVHIEFHSPIDELEASVDGIPNDFGEGVRIVRPVGRQTLWKITRLALGKTFRGMDHAAEMARRCAILLGA